MYYELANEVEQVLGKALGYPRYSDDQKNFPGTTEADGVCVGENVPESLLSEAAAKIENIPVWHNLSRSIDWDYSSTSTLPLKSLFFDKTAETPCTAEIEVEFEKLATYFEKRAKENARRAEKEENKRFPNVASYAEGVQSDRSSYYFSGKADSYKRVAEKVREILGK
jgi:hypothetical protein